MEVRREKKRKAEWKDSRKPRRSKTMRRGAQCTAEHLGTDAANASESSALPIGKYSCPYSSNLTYMALRGEEVMSVPKTTNNQQNPKKSYTPL